MPATLMEPPTRRSLAAHMATAAPRWRMVVTTRRPGGNRRGRVSSGRPGLDVGAQPVEAAQPRDLLEVEHPRTVVGEGTEGGVGGSARHPGIVGASGWGPTPRGYGVVVQPAGLLPEDTVDRMPVPDGSPPVAGAQWDEVRGCWERWDEGDGRWHVIGVAVDESRPPARPFDEIDLHDAAVTGAP